MHSEDILELEDIQAGYDDDSTEFESLNSSITAVDTLIISDVHLGSEVARSKPLLRTLMSHSFRRLILNGDIFDDLNFKRLGKNDWKVLSHIRKLSHPKRGCEVIWIIGNHDSAAEVLSHFLGVEVVEEYLWEFQGKKYYATHGHQFDRFVTKNVRITHIANACYLIIQKLDTKNQRFSRWVKRTSKKFIGVSNKTAKSAIKLAKKKGADFIFCGHTHRPAQQSASGITYINSGCWTDKPATFVTIDEVGGVRIREVE
jgi:UDP-2,3-diacylglucosamine pyrophosphatase LpxH